MKYAVRPTWVKFAGTDIPSDAAERSKRSFTYIQEYFQKMAGSSFEFRKLTVLSTPQNKEYFLEYHTKSHQRLRGLNQIWAKEGVEVYAKFGPADRIFFGNLISLIRENLGAGENNIWVIFVPISGLDPSTGLDWLTSQADGIGGNYIILPTARFFGKTRDGFFTHLAMRKIKITQWGEGGWVEGEIAHELGHTFGLEHCYYTEPCLTNLERCIDVHLMGEGYLNFPNCDLPQSQKDLLLKSRYFST